MKLWTVRSKCEKKKRKRKPQLSRESKKADVGVQCTIL